MLLDIGTMNNIEIDEDNQLAIVQPGARSIQLMAAARDKGLQFPVPHCPTVGIAVNLKSALLPACLLSGLTPGVKLLITKKGLGDACPGSSGSPVRTRMPFAGSQNLRSVCR